MKHHFLKRGLLRDEEIWRGRGGVADFAWGGPGGFLEEQAFALSLEELTGVRRKRRQAGVGMGARG